MLSTDGNNPRRRSDVRGNSVRTRDLPHLFRPDHRFWEAASIDYPRADARACARNSARAQASARPHPEKDVASDEGVSVHRRSSAGGRKHFAVSYTHLRAHETVLDLV